MNMTFSFTLWELGYLIIGILLIILLIYIISCVKNTIAVLKSTKNILDDVNVVTDIASTKSKEIESAVTKVTDAAGIWADAVKGNQNKTKAATSLVNAILALKNLFFNSRETTKK